MLQSPSLRQIPRFYLLNFVPFSCLSPLIVNCQFQMWRWKVSGRMTAVPCNRFTVATVYLLLLLHWTFQDAVFEIIVYSVSISVLTSVVEIFGTVRTVNAKDSETTLQPHALYLASVWYDMIWYTIRYDMIRYDMIYRVIQNDCRGFNNLSYTIHLR